MSNILWRSLKWRFQNPISILITILQPMIWLILYSTVARQTMQNVGLTNYTAYILPGIMVLVILAACSSSGIVNFIMKTNGSFYRILIAPVRRSSIILGQTLEAVLVSFIEVFILAVVSLFFGVRLTTGPVGMIIILILIFLAAFFYSCIAYAISLHLPNEIIYETVMNAIVLPLFFLSSALFPVRELRGPLGAAITLNPYTHMINILRTLIITDRVPLRETLSVIILFLILSMLGYLLAAKSLRKQTSH